MEERSGEVAAAQEDEGDAELAGLVRGIDVEGLGKLAEGGVGIVLSLEGDGPLIEAGLGLEVVFELRGPGGDDVVRIGVLLHERLPDI